MAEVLLKTNRFRVEIRQYILHNGRTVAREVVVHPGAVVILPILGDDQIVMVRNVRHTVEKELLELPAGTREPGEEPIETARRELEEETGYRAEKLVPLAKFYTSPGITDELMHAFVATGLTHVGQDLDDSEEIAVEVCDFDAVRKLLATAGVHDAKTLAVLGIYFAAQKA
jgi:ADP-ribose pyrophosphatase